MKEVLKCKICRREGQKLFLKGEKCSSPKCPFTRRSYAPGQHGQVAKKISDYGIQLREKQKAKRIYGISERQFKNYFKVASKKAGDTEEILFQLLERRLDNVIYRLGFAPSRRAARQAISHGHFLVNQKKVNIPSYLIKKNDKIEFVKKPTNLQLKKEEEIPSWLKLDKSKLVGQCLSFPTKKELEGNIDMAQIIEFYSK